MSAQIDTERKSFTDEKYDPEGKVIIDEAVIAVSFPLHLLHFLRILMFSAGSRRCFL